MTSRKAVVQPTLKTNVQRAFDRIRQRNRPANGNTRAPAGVRRGPRSQGRR